jgi:hypothetical protein
MDALERKVPVATVAQLAGHLRVACEVLRQAFHWINKEFGGGQRNLQVEPDKAGRDAAATEETDVPF